MATYTISGVIDLSTVVPYGSGDQINVSGTGSGDFYVKYSSLSTLSGQNTIQMSGTIMQFPVYSSGGGGGGGGIQPQTFGQLYPWGNRY
jgi:hypothetical protein